MDTYTHGHHESVVSHHAARTAANSAAFLLPSLRPGMGLLDVGCGPGSITLDLATAVDPGQVTGIDVVDEVLVQARVAARQAGIGNVRFRHGSVYGLDLADDSVDVTYAHQVLQHLTDPAAALREMRRVTAPGGLVAVRDADYGGFFWEPDDPRLDRWLELYHQVVRHNGAEADAGRMLPRWMAEAGFSDVAITTSTWHYATPEERHWWADGWRRRATESDFAGQAVDYGLASRAELRTIADAWGWWAEQPSAVFVIPHVEAIGRV